MLISGDHIVGSDRAYTALSHCWGPATASHSAKTRKATESSHRLGMSMHDLPLTFRDAIIVTRALNVRYIWIDSLCIVQDDVLDW
jgi:hypothetical protein